MNRSSTSRRARNLAALAILVLSHLSAANSFAASGEQFEFRKDDRIVLLGGTFIEREQQYGYLESLLNISLPDKQLTFRNLGWSGDTVWGESRAVFGTQVDGFSRLVKDTKEAKPTVIMLCYGANEAQAGPQGLPRFVQGYNHLLDTLDDTGARFVLISPPKRHRPSKRLPDPTPYNQSLEQYARAIQELAQQRSAFFINLTDTFDRTGESLIARLRAQRDEKLPLVNQDGVQLSDEGYYLCDLAIVDALVNIEKHSPAATSAVDASNKKASVEHGRVSDLERTQQGIRFKVELERLPWPSNVFTNGIGPVQVKGLEPGTYELRIDGESVAKKDQRDWDGQRVLITKGPDFQQVEELRELARQKNELYFHRYRPQNETYLFLFRKHEQGNNAVEIPQFDPLVAEKEKQIFELSKPRARTYELVRVQ